MTITPDLGDAVTVHVTDKRIDGRTGRVTEVLEPSDWDKPIAVLLPGWGAPMWFGLAEIEHPAGQA